MIVQIYVDDIEFGSTKHEQVEEFIELMKNEFEMSMDVGGLSFWVYKLHSLRMVYVYSYLKLNMPKM